MRYTGLTVLLLSGCLVIPPATMIGLHYTNNSEEILMFTKSNDKTLNQFEVGVQVDKSKGEGTLRNVPSPVTLSNSILL